MGVFPCGGANAVGHRHAASRAGPRPAARGWADRFGRQAGRRSTPSVSLPSGTEWENCNHRGVDERVRRFERPACARRARARAGGRESARGARCRVGNPRHRRGRFPPHTWQTPPASALRRPRPAPPGAFPTAHVENTPGVEAQQAAPERPATPERPPRPGRRPAPTPRRPRPPHRAGPARPCPHPPPPVPAPSAAAVGRARASRRSARPGSTACARPPPRSPARRAP